MQHDTWGTGLAGDPTSLIVATQLHVFAVDGAGNLQHWWRGQNGLAGPIAHETWGSGAAGRPTAMVVNHNQHVWVRGTNGELLHFRWNQVQGLQFDVWAQGITSDPAATRVGNQEQVFATDSTGALSQWVRPVGGGQDLTHQTWHSGAVGRPSTMQVSAHQHAFSRGVDGSLLHTWFTPNIGFNHDVWGGGLVQDPTAILFTDQQHVFAQDANGVLHDWWWQPGSNVREIILGA